MDEDTWLSYRDVIYFLLGTERARGLWHMCRPYFNPEYVAMVDEIMGGMPTIDFWDQLAAVR